MIYTALRAAMIYQACGLDKKRTKLSLRSFLAPPVGLDLHLLPHWVGENKGVAAVFSVGNNSPSYCCGARQKLRLTVQARFSPTATHTAPLLLPPLAAQRLVAAATRSPPCFRPRRRSGRSPNAELGERIATPVCGLVRDDTVFGTFRSKAGAFGIDSFVIARP